MSTAEPKDQGVLPPTYRTVTPPYRGRGDGEMTFIGLGYALLLAIVLVPLAPFLAFLWVTSKLIDAVRGRRVE